MKRRGKKKRSPELIALQEAFWLEVVLGGDPEGAAQPCWYATLPDAGPCAGRILASHFIKKQRIGNAVYAQLRMDLGAAETAKMVQRAEWDPRFAVPGCQQHDDRWDCHQTPPLVIWRHQVPPLVEMAAEDWSIGEQLAHRCPSICSERCTPAQHTEFLNHDQGGMQ